MTVPAGRRGASVELRDYLSVLARRRHVVVVVFAATLAVALTATLLRPAKWTGTATMRVEPTASLVGGTVQADDVKYLDRLVNTYSQLASSVEMRDRVASELDLDARPTIDFAQVPNTNLVRLSVTTSDRDSAAPAARRVATLLISQVETLASGDATAAEQSFDRRTARVEQEKAHAEAELERLEADPSKRFSEAALLLREQINGMSQRLAAQRADHERYQSTREANERALTVVAEPTRPRAPENRNLKLALALGLMLGLIMGPSVAFVAENLSRRFRSRDEIEASINAPILSAVPVAGDLAPRTLFDSGSPADEAIRRLRTTLLMQSRAADRPADMPRTMLVTSAYPGEGKSTVVANLGRSLAQSGQSTLLIDADLHRPVLHEYFGLPNDGGLSDILRAPKAVRKAQWSRLFRQTGVGGLALLCAGEHVDDAPTLLGMPWASSAMFVELADRYEYVLIDAPAVLTVPDALAITRNVDGVLLVAATDVDRDALRHAREQLSRVGADIVGIVVNGAADASLYPYVGYGPPDASARRGGAGTPV
jgi:capsular exopolysaccharide synthesis family protein